MNPESAPPHIERRLAALATRQYGVLTRAQLGRLGIGPTGIRERIRSGRLQRLHRGVYAVVHTVLRAQAFRLAAVLACGDRAVLSHASAAAHWNIRQSAATRIDVTVSTMAGRRQRRGIRVHRTRRLPPHEVTTHDRIPTTTVARTLLDLADVLPRQALKRTIDEAEYKRLFDLTSLIAAVEDNPGRRGAGKLLELVQGPAEMTRSELEQRMLALIETHNLPRPRVGQFVEGYEADFLWPRERLIVETDGFQAHSTRSAFEGDRRRDRRLRRAGYETIRLTARDFRYEEDAVAADLAEALMRSRTSSKPPSRSSTSVASAT